MSSFGLKIILYVERVKDIPTINPLKEQQNTLKYFRPVFLEVLLMWSLITLLCMRFNISFNEMDIIPYARSVYNQRWIPGDAYLSQDIPYRYLFCYMIGFFADRFGMVETIFTGRLITYLLFSMVFFKLIRLLELNIYLRIFTFIAFLRLFHRGFGDVDEWIVGGLETKVFAYCFAILGLTFFLKKDPKYGLFFSGIALSFHLLVGGYHLICLLPILLIDIIRDKTYFKRLLVLTPVYLLAASMGIYAIYDHLVTAVDENSARQAWDIYVNVRLPHHTLPIFSNKTKILMIIFTPLNLIILFNSCRYKKFIAIYGLSSVGLLVIGLAIYFFFDDQYLRFYWFRFSDVMLPFTSIILLMAMLHGFPAANHRPYIHKTVKIIGYVFLIACSIGILYKPIKDGIKEITFNKQELKSRTCPDEKMMRWIKNNTPKHATFLTSPNQSYFYINAERSMWVSWKHFPQSPESIMRWYQKIKRLNGGVPVKSIHTLNNNFFKLTEQDFFNIFKSYPGIDYILLPIEMHLKIPSVFATDKYRLYKMAL